MKKNKKLTIVCFGDSTTADNFILNEQYQGEYADLKVYSSHLKEKLPSILGKEIEVINSGVSGDTTEDAKLRFQKDVKDHHPDIVIIQFGVNDQVIRQDLGLSKPKVDLDLYCYNVLFFVQRCRDLRNAQVILMTPGMMLWTETFRTRFLNDPFDQSDQYGINNNLKGYVEKVRVVARNEQIPLVDIYQLQYTYDTTSGCSLKDFLTDGLHPNNKAHKFIADAIINEIQANYK